MQLFPLRKGALHTLRGGAVWSARRAHNPKVGGSNPPPATKIKSLTCKNGQGFLLRGNFPVEKVYPTACFFTLWKGSGSRPNRGSWAPFIFPRDNRAGEFGGNFLEMSRDYGGITALAGGTRNSNPRRCNAVSERPKTASFPPLPGRLPAACRGRRNVMRIACFQCCSWDARHPQRYWTPIMGAGLAHFLTTGPSQAMRQVPHSRHPA